MWNFLLPHQAENFAFADASAPGFKSYALRLQRFRKGEPISVFANILIDASLKVAFWHLVTGLLVLLQNELIFDHVLKLGAFQFGRLLLEQRGLTGITALKRLEVLLHRQLHV